MGFTLKILTNYIKSVVSFGDWKLQSGKLWTQNWKNIVYEFTYLITINKYTLKKSASNAILSRLLPSKEKVL